MPDLLSYLNAAFGQAIGVVAPVIGITLAMGMASWIVKMINDAVTPKVDDNPIQLIDMKHEQPQFHQWSPGDAERARRIREAQQKSASADSVPSQPKPEPAPEPEPIHYATCSHCGATSPAPGRCDYCGQPVELAPEPARRSLRFWRRS